MSAFFSLPVLSSGRGAGLAALLLLVFAQTAGATEKKVVLRVSGLPNPAITTASGVAAQRTVERFLELNPDVELQAAEGLRIETVSSEVTTIMMIAGDIAPDVLNMNFRSMDTFVSQGMVAPLDEFVARAKSQGVDVAGRILPQVKPVVYRPWPEGENHLYGLPQQFSVVGLFYNKELFRRAGLPQRAPKDWTELREFARKITALGPGIYGLRMNAGQGASWNLMNLLWSAGGEAVKEVAPNEWRADFNTPAAVEAYRFYYELLEIDRVMTRTSVTSDSQQERETVGMFFDYIGDSAKTNLDSFSFGAVPAGPTGLRGSEINSRVLGIYSQIKDPAVKEAAWRYILFMSGPEAERIRVDTMVEFGEAGQVNPLLLRRYGYEQFLALSPPGLEAEIEAAVQNGKPEPYGRNCNLVYLEMNYPLDQILLSKRIRRLWEEGNLRGVSEEIQNILNRAVERTNERMIGYVAPEAMRVRRVVAGLAVTAIVVIFLFVARYVLGIFARNMSGVSRPVKGRTLLPWLCLLPACGLILIWNYVPLARGTVMAFQDYQLILDSAFIGFDNFAIALFDPTFWNAIVATLHFAAYTLTFGFVTPIALAYALHIIPRHKILFRTVYYLPAVMSAATVFFLWRELFGLDGPLNEMLRFFGFEARRPWTGDPYLAMLSCVIPGIWAGAGPGCLIYLAALKTIPEEQFEAAEIDGAGFVQKTLQVVIPSLRALIFINFIGAVAAAFHGATNILIMTGGGPNGLTEVISLKIFYEAFSRLRFGPATAMAWIMGSLLVGFTVIQLKRLSQMEFKTSR
jgi:ABC-type sugar transport system permease subunit/ABC-type glycerol-3-phosphate transport system substrate-binding protein